MAMKSPEFFVFLRADMKKLHETKDFLIKAGISDPEIAIILGTGLGKLVDRIKIELVIPYEEIPYFPVSTVEFHKGELIYGSLSGRKVLAMHGRFHYYEGYSLKEVVFPVRVMKLLGIKTLLVSNACGTINMDIPKGSLMMLTDHINMLGDNPLIGPNYDELGPRFPDMSEPYSREINELMRKVADDKGIVLHEGVYVAFPGPMLETRAEYRFLQRIGADVVGMSTVPEAIAARHMGLPCAAVSVITDECDPDNLAVADINDILANAALAEEDLMVLFEEVVAKLAVNS
jgi:purine-nucleoside phosphorylase